MRIVHLCLAGMITEGWSYQENMLIKYHMLMGHEVSVITTQWIRVEKRIEKIPKNDYTGEYGARYLRLPISNKDRINNRFKRFSGIEKALDDCDPEVLFIHGLQFPDSRKIAKYLSAHPGIVTYVDNHSDYSNSGKKWLSRNLLHKGLWRHCAHKINPYVKKFYGVLPVRVDFLRDVYKLPAEKCELLVMGTDDELAEKAKTSGARERIREKYGIAADDFLIMTGGKMDQWKTQTILLMQAIRNINRDHVKLIVFGSVSSELMDQVTALADGKQVQYIGWIQSKDSYEFFEASDLVVFPGRHSVLWEQAAGQGKPLIVKDWPGTHHVDLGGNVRFLYHDTVEEIQEEIERLIDDPEIFDRMVSVAQEKGMKAFSYKEIAKRAIEADEYCEGAGQRKE